MADRRKFPRLIGPFKGTWIGRSRGDTCQIRDISLDGCFVESMTTPERDEETVITFEVEGEEFAAPAGTVVYVESPTSFSVKFRAMTAKERSDLSVQITRLIQSPRAKGGADDWGEAVPSPYHQKRQLTS
jgi:hypothetical protein